MITISNELLSVVLGKDVSDAAKEDDTICYYNWSNNGASECIDIDELVFRCMEWAFKKGYAGIGYIEPSIVFKECDEIRKKDK